VRLMASATGPRRATHTATVPLPRPDTVRCVAGEFENIRTRLEAISEELADLAMARLRDSIDAGGTELPLEEKRLTRARRAIDKAAYILREPDEG